MFIRTKDGIYVLSEAYWAGNKDEILAEADTIEELCDEFVNFQMVDSEEKAFEYVRAFNSKHTKYIAKWEEIL